jgi:hypothetical protein
MIEADCSAGVTGWQQGDQLISPNVRNAAERTQIQALLSSCDAVDSPACLR